ncbi:hypothetical protein ES705_08408 [subsurface metagenome]
MAGFCDYLKDISAKCATCVENKMGACHIKLGLQEYYPKDFQLYDTIQIIRHDGRLSVETDIEVKYKTDYAYGAFAGKGPEWERECTKKAGKIREYLQPQLPPGARFSNFHVHYHPDKYDPNIVPLHIHVHKLVEDLDEAKDVALKLAETIRPSEIEASIR